MASNAPQPGFAFSGQARHRLSYGEIKQLAQAYGLPGDAIAQISEGESNRYADVQQRDPGDGMVGYGLLQMTPNAWGKNSAATKYMEHLGGISAMRDPAKNMAMARFLYKAAGNKLTPWYGTRYLTNRSGEGTLGPVDHSKLGGAVAGRGAPTQSAAVPGAPAVDNSALRAQAVQQFLGSKSADPVTFAMAIRGAQDVPATPATASAQPQAPQGAGGMPQLGGGQAGAGQLKITGPNPGRIKPSVIQFGRKVSAIYGKPLTGSDGTGHSRLTVNGNVSQHTTGNATDIPASGTELLRMGRAALIAAGMPREQAMKQKGGLFNVGAHQIIFLTNEGGNHFDHLHISSR